MCLVFDEVVFDEVKVNSDLVYDKHSAELVGFVEIISHFDELGQT